MQDVDRIATSQKIAPSEHEDDGQNCKFPTIDIAVFLLVGRADGLVSQEDYQAMGVTGRLR